MSNANIHSDTYIILNPRFSQLREVILRRVIRFLRIIRKY